MEIREEYKQLKAELKRIEDRNRKLDLLSVGINTEVRYSELAIEAYIYNETGLYPYDILLEIFSFYKKMFEIEHIMEDYSDFSRDWDWNKYESFDGNAYYFELCYLEHYIDFFNSISDTNKLTSVIGDNSIIEKIEWTVKQSEVIVSAIKNAFLNPEAITMGMIMKYQLTFFQRENEWIFEYLYEELIGIKQSRELSDDEFDLYIKDLSEKYIYYIILQIVFDLILYLLLEDEEPRYVQLVERTFKRLHSTTAQAVQELDCSKLFSSNHTLDDVFNILKMFPAIVIKNLFMYLSLLEDIDFAQCSAKQCSAIQYALINSDMDLFKSSITNDLATIFCWSYSLIKLFYSIILRNNSRTEKERELAHLYTRRHYTEFLISKWPVTIVDLKDPIVKNDTNTIFPLVFEKSINNSPLILGFLTYCYQKNRSDIHPEDRKYFDRIFTQEPYKEYCDKALLELDKQCPDDNSFSVFYRCYCSLLGLDSQRQESTDKPLTSTHEEVSSPASKPALVPNSEMKPNPFGGLNSDALMVCGNDIRGYVGMFIDYLIYRGYLNLENKEAFVCSMCEVMIPKSTIDNLIFNETNKEGKSNKNIVTLMISRLTNFTSNNEIKVDSKVISKGSIYFNKRQVDNGELQEWCLFWPFLIERIRRGKGSLFQKSETIPESEIDGMLGKVGEFIKEYERTGGSMTKLEFIKKRHQLLLPAKNCSIE